jgi:hypothetical protein
LSNETEKIVDMMKDCSSFVGLHGMWILNKFNRRCLYYYRYLQYFKITRWFLFTLMSLSLTYIFPSNKCWGPKSLNIRMHIFTPC